MAQELRPSLDLHPDGAATNDVLTWDGSKWIPAAAGGGASIDTSAADIGSESFGAAAAAGSTGKAADAGHVHPMPANPTGQPLALTGATTATRYVGGTPSGAPTTGTFAVGDYVCTADGHIFVCTTAGSPGTWRDVAGSGSGGVAVQDEGTALGTATTINWVGAGVTATFSGSTATVTVPGASGGGSSLLAVVAYNPTSTTTYSTSSATFSAVDATNLKITFTAPASGKALIQLNALGATSTTSASLRWALLDNTGALIGGTQKYVTNTTNPIACAADILIGGLTGGTSYTYQWGFCSSNATLSVSTYAGGSGSTAPGWAGQAVMEAWSV